MFEPRTSSSFVHLHRNIFWWRLNSEDFLDLIPIFLLSYPPFFCGQNGSNQHFSDFFSDFLHQDFVHIYRIYPNMFLTFIRDFYGFLCNFPMGCFEIPWFWLPDTRTGWKATWFRRAPASVQASLGECLDRTEKVRGWIRIHSLFNSNSIPIAGWWFGT